MAEAIFVSESAAHPVLVGGELPVGYGGKARESDERRELSAASESEEKVEENVLYDGAGWRAGDSGVEFVVRNCPERSFRICGGL
jgi:hypothetical protein